MQWNTILKSLGFTESEAKLYLLSLEIGPSAVQELAKKAKVSRVTAYTVIEALSERGLMSSLRKGKKTLYVAESPERLVSFVRARVAQMETTLREVESLINDLKLLQRGEKPVVKLFEGKEGLKAIHDDILQTNPDVMLEFVNVDALLTLFSREEFVPYHRELDARKVQSENILLSSKLLPPRTNVKNHLLSIGDFSFFGDITIYRNKIALTTLRGKNISVLIESEILAQMMRELFRLAIKGAEQQKKNSAGP